MKLKLFGCVQRGALLGTLISIFVINNLLWGQVRAGFPDESRSITHITNQTDQNRRQREESENETALSRQKWFFEQRAYPFGFIPPDARFKAFEYMKAKMGYQPEKSKLSIEGSTAWVSIGPNNVGGRMLSIALHPTDLNIVYCGAADGGVWKSTNAGSSWTPLTDTLPSLAIGALVIDPRNPDIIYAGTGEGSFNIDAATGAGVLKSTDGGKTWAVGSVFSRYINKLVIDPRNTQVIYAASRDGVFKSTDGRASWNRLLEGNASDLVLDPNAPDTLYTSLWGNPATNTPGGIYKTTDGGANWTLLKNGLPPANQIGRVAFAMAPSMTRVLYAGIGTARAGPFQGMYKTTDGGESWTLVFDSPAYCFDQCWYDNVLAVDPKNPEVVYAGGTPLYKSTDGGRSWNEIASNVHVDYHAIVFSPTDPRTIYVGNDGGIYKSTDDGANWVSLNDGLVTAQFYTLGLAKSDPTITMGGTQDNGTLKHNRGRAWAEILGGDGGFVAIDHNDPRIIYAEFQFFGFAKSTDGGVTWRGAHDGISFTEPMLFITPFVMDPQDAQVLYMGTNRLYKTADGAGRWFPISGNLARQRWGSVSAIGISPSSTRTIYVGTSDGYVWRTDTGGEPWQLVISGLPDRFVRRIRVHPTNPQIAYVTFSGFGAGHVFKTTDGGARWQDISSNLPDLPVNAIVIDPVNPSVLYIGTDLGVFRTLNDGGEWMPFNDGFPNVIVDDLEFFGNGHLLRAATHGRGMFQISTPTDKPARIKPLSRVQQKTLVSNEFAMPLHVLVTDSDNIPIPEVSVTFSVPMSGPGGTFPEGTPSVTAITDFNGVAQAPPFTANGTAGSYQIEARANGVEAPARFVMENVTDGPRIESVSPSRASFGQRIVIRGSNFSRLSRVIFFQQGNVFILPPFNFFLSADATAITVSIPEPPGLVAGPCALAVTANGVHSNPATFEIAPVYTPPVITGLVPAAPSPGQRFVISLDGQLPSLERVTITQGSTSFTSRVPADAALIGGIVVSLPEQGFQPGPATIIVTNENSPASVAFTFNIPNTPQPTNLRSTSRLSAAIGQAFSLRAEGNAFATNADRNILIFTQQSGLYSRSIEVPAIGFSGLDLVAAVPEGLSMGLVSVQVKSTFTNGEATSNALDLRIDPTPASPALTRLVPGINAPITFFSSSSAPGGIISILSSSGSFNLIPGNNTVFFSQGQQSLTSKVLSVDPKGSRLDVMVPDTLSPGPVMVFATTTFNGVESPRSNVLTLNLFPFFVLTGAQPASQTLTVNTISPDRFTVRLMDSGGQPLRARIFFVAPYGGPSGTFANTGGSTLASVIADRDGIATSPLFRANGKTGSYNVLAFIPGLNVKAEFSITNVSPPQNTMAMNVSARGAQTFQTVTNPDSIQVGYATATASQSPAPAGVAIFGWKPADILLTEAGVGAAMPTRSALIFVDTQGSINTGLALVNPNDQPAILSWTLYDREGRVVGRAAERTLPAHRQTAVFVNDPGLFGSMANNMVGTLAIESNVPVASVTLRMTLNDRGNVILTTLPVADAAASAAPASLIFPHLVIGGPFNNEFNSEVILVNAQTTTIRGRILLFAQNGTPLNVISGTNIQTYSIAPKGAFLLQTTSGSDIAMGYAVVEPESGSAAPAGGLIFRSLSMGTVITEAGVGAATLTRDSLIYAESTNTTTTGFAIANANDVPATLTFTLYDMDGNRITAASQTLPGRQQMARFVDQLIPSAANLKGTLKITSSIPVAGLTLRGTTNQRGDFILTTLPVSDISNPAAGKNVLFPHLAFGGGFATQLVMLSGGLETAGQLNLFSQDGQPFTLIVK